MIAKYAAVFFDAGGTLFRPHPSVGEIYREVALRYGTDVPASAIEARFHDLWHQRDGLTSLSSHADEKKEKHWWHGLVREVFAPYGGVCDFDRYFDELYDYFGSAACWRLYPDTLEVLGHCAGRGQRLFVVSNWDSRLYAICQGLAITDFFDSILASAVIGAAKPNPRIFEEALRRAGLKGCQAVHIGDSFEDDVRGASAAGVDAIWVDRHHRRHREPSHFEGVTIIESLKELIEKGG